MALFLTFALQWELSQQLAWREANIFPQVFSVRWLRQWLQQYEGWVQQVQPNMQEGQLHATRQLFQQR